MEYRHFYLAQEFVQKGYNVSIISGSYSHLFSKQPAINNRFTLENIDGITYCWVRIPYYQRSISIGRLINMLIFMFQLFKLPVSLLPVPNAIIVSSPSLFPVLPALNWKKRFNCKFIFEVRDIWPLTLQELGNFSSWHPVILFMSFFERKAYRHADNIVSLLPKSKDYFISKKMSEDKFVYIPNGVSLTSTNQKDFTHSISNFLQLPRDKFIVGYVGTIGEANNLIHLIQAAQMLNAKNKNIHFVITGQGDQRIKLMELSKDLSNVTFLEVIEKNAVPYLLSHFDACYIGLKNEPLFRFGVSPNKLFDYMLASKPIIYAINSGNKPVDEANCGVSVPADNPTTLANEIEILSQKDKTELNVMGRNGHNYLMRFHTYEKLASKYIELFK